MSYLNEYTLAHSAQATWPATHPAGKCLEILKQPFLSHIQSSGYKTHLHNAATTRRLWFHDLQSNPTIKKVQKSHNLAIP